MDEKRSEEAMTSLAIMTALAWVRKVASETPNPKTEDHEDLIRSLNETIAIAARWRLEAVVEIEGLLDAREDEVHN
ncbi:MAG: hypothetical protein AAFY34_15195 [Pseudomonadota bacterium]